MRNTEKLLPQQAGDIFITDGGVETTLIYEFGVDLEDFAAFPLLRTVAGRNVLKTYFRRHASIASARGLGFVFESATWRASQDWGDRLGYSPVALDQANRTAIHLLEEVRDEFPGMQNVISGCVGPRGDGYDPGTLMSAHEAKTYHQQQVATFAKTAAQMVTGVTMTNTPEAIGLTHAAQGRDMPVVIAFTVETDGCLPTGQPLGEAIEELDAKTQNGPAYYMISCAHPDHFRRQLRHGGDWLRRLGGLRANASRCSHEELDNATELDAGNPVELGQDYAALRREFPHLTVLGGCCGTDHRHISEIAQACLQDQSAVASA